MRSMTTILLVVLGACGGKASTAQPAPSAPSSTSGPPQAPDFSYDAGAALDVQPLEAARTFGDVTISTITYASPRGGRVPALLVEPTAPAAGGKRPAVILQHGMGAVDKYNLLPDAVLFARAGAIALLPDSPDQRLASMRVLDFADHDHDPALWNQTAIDLRRGVDLLGARADVDPQRIGFVGHSFGATMGAILAATEPRLRAFVLIAPGAYTRTVREGQTAGLETLRKNVPPAALAGYLASMEPYDAPLWLARAPATAHVLLQFAHFDPGVPATAVTDLIEGSTATTETRHYPTGHFITSPASMRDRLDFLARTLGLPRAADAMVRELTEPPP